RLREHKQDTSGECDGEAQGLEDTSGRASEWVMGRGNEQRRRHDQIAAHVTEPPRTPYRGRMRKRDRVADQQARNADARADDRAEGGAEDDQRDYVPDARETRTK